jgi:ribosomal protein S18 acetylase RimI-like enzyme
MLIRELTAADAPDYRAIRLRALWEYPEAFTSSYEEEGVKAEDWYERRLTSPGTRFWGAFGDGQLCGVVGLEREARAKNRHKATVLGMYVATEYKGQGIGRLLMEALCAAARGDGLESLVLTVTQGNDLALQLYESVGFRSFGIEPRAIKIDGKFFSKNHMVLELASS